MAVAVHEGRLLLPEDGAPTTHILKVPRPAERSLVQDELSLLRIAAGVQGHPVVRAEVLEAGAYRGLLIERYDRRIEDGLVTRIHQEDFCQALGLAPALKYERDAAIPERRFDAGAIGRVLDQTDAPALARRAFFFGTLLNIALGNTDNHAKNHSLLYDRGARPRLAPFYDIVPVMMDGRVTRDFSFRIGAAGRLSDLRPGDLAAFAEAIGFRRFSAGLARRLREVLQSAADQIDSLQGPGFKSLGDALGGQMAELSDRLDLGLIVPARDLFIAKGVTGGW
ncbi:MAG: HipA domain-containing protein [Sedimentitalea sp.]|nr:HipA domain-containing protein [Sedimentitalea sp.]